MRKAVRIPNWVFDGLRWVVSRRPWAVVAVWVVLAVAVGVLAPDLTKLAAEGQAKLLPTDAESVRAAEVVRKAWPDQWYESLAAVALFRKDGLTDTDRDFARRLARRFVASGRPANVMRVMGPDSPEEVASRLVSRDKTVELVAVPLSTSFVGPTSADAVRWLQEQAAAPDLTPPAGLKVFWSGDAVIGRDYMRNVQTSLDRAALATVVLLLGVLLAVYRSLWLAAIPLATIGMSLVISRGILAWMTVAGWEISPLVELFLVVLLFGSGTDFCLFVSWRFGEHWNTANPGGAMRVTLRYVLSPLLTSAGTVIIGLSLMGFTKFKLFSSTGPSVAIGLALTLLATLTLTPSLLVLLAQHRPRTFKGLTAPPSGFWDVVGHKVLARPILTWLGTVVVMLPLAVLGLSAPFIQDTFSELPGTTPSVRGMRLIADRFGPGVVAPLTVVIEADQDLHQSQGLALIDDVSRLLAHQRRLVEVRSATQPLGSSAPLEPARLSARLGAIDTGFNRMVSGATQLETGLAQGAAKLRAALLLEEFTGIHLTGPGAASSERPETEKKPAEPPAGGGSLFSGLRRASSAMLGGDRKPEPESADPSATKPKTERPADPRAQMLTELVMAADGARQIAEGALRAQQEISGILEDPVGRRALDRLLITPNTIREHPELRRSFAAYLSPDGKAARVDLTQTARVFSADAMEQVGTLRRRLKEYLDENEEIHARAVFTGANAESADVWALTRTDQELTWIIVPLGVFVILLLALRDIWACLNLVATMLLTYAFALGMTHLVFVTMLGAEGIDWKVPYFLFVLLVAVGVDYNVFLMTRLQEEANALGLRAGINRAIAQTGGLISSAAAITACSFASFLFSPLGSLRQLGFALVVGITVDAVLVRPLLVPCGHWLMNRRRERKRVLPAPTTPIGHLARVAD
ncbi:MAG TPA: MMPL family transporter [Isosphaeraceae bacterium]|nr:MMPL family transporter [Isosphaeraceae bacterium]